MTFIEFKNIVLTIKTAYPLLKAFDVDQGIEIWFEMLKDLDYQVVSAAVSTCIKESPYPPVIADIRNLSRKIVTPDWSVEWQKLLKKAVVSDLNAPAQYALNTMTEDYVLEMMNCSEKIVLCMKEFERLYNNWFRLTVQDKEALRKLGVWENDRNGIVQMDQKFLTTRDGRMIQ